MAAATFATAGDVLTAAQYNLLPRGVVGLASTTSNQTGYTTEEDLVGLTVTWTATSSRRYRITAQTNVESSAAGDSLRVYITDGSNTVKQASLTVADAVSTAETTTLSVTETGLSGSTTRKLRFAVVGSGTGASAASATNPSFILVEDIGAA